MLSDCAEQAQSNNDEEASTDELVIDSRVGSVKCAGSLPNKIGECFFVNVKAECAEDDSSGVSALPVNSSTALNAIISTNKTSIPNMASCATVAGNSDATTSGNCRRGILLLPMSVNGDQTMCRVFTCNLQADVATDSS
jgi:hypothetical protein